ncbi:MAG TPA: glutamate-1-semialdehyde 2,1-aminomutase [Candidatus Kapabacteria bacterium]|nr:glutamate-1-semialdehyde 2,1-aminomutase [Candidatus Kapabacteria bacterium]
MTNAELFERARRVIPGGVNSPVRAFGAVGGTPLFFESADGAWLTDAEGGRYLDYVGSWGPFILGHGHPAVRRALHEQTDRATSFGAPSRLEVELAELLTSLIPGLEMVRLVSSGTEATMSAVRAARGYTGREKFIKFEGCYHGHGDAFLIRAGSGMLTHGAPSSPGVTAGAAADTLVAVYNDIASVRELFDANQGEIAAVIIEPVAGNMGVVPATQEFLEELRALCSANGSVLIFDEVMSGFRVALGGASSIYGITPDLVTYGKIIGGGLPVGAYGGRRDIMSVVSPLGAVYQAGTLSGNPLAVAAGLATLRTLVESDPYPQLARTTATLAEGLRAAAGDRPVAVNHVGSMITLFFTEGPVDGYASAVGSDSVAFGRFFHGMLRRGIYLPPSQFEAWFVSAAHTSAEIDRTVEAARDAIAELAVPA